MRKDYLKHIIYSFAIAIILATGIHFFWAEHLKILAWPATVFIGLTKEVVWDGLLKKGDPDFKDLWCDVWGAGLGTILTMMIL